MGISKPCSTPDKIRSNCSVGFKNFNKYSNTSSSKELFSFSLLAIYWSALSSTEEWNERFAINFKAPRSQYIFHVLRQLVFTINDEKRLRVFASS